MLKPDHAPEAARKLTIGEVADRHRELKNGHGRLRAAFPFLRFNPSGHTRSIERAADGSVKLVLIQGGLHPKPYAFTSEQAEETACWYWRAADEAEELGAPLAA